ncbi:MAG: hypothetical protein RL095_425 [Verrucomicrobiota bacterium]|jgi:hypothetical protein
MIHHLSLAVENPRHVAQVLANLLRGAVTGFGPYPNSYIAWAADDVGTAIELLPIGTQMRPGAGKVQAQFFNTPDASGLTATHVALSVPLEEAEVLEIARQQGWRAVRMSRGWNDVIELWIENRVLVEVMTPSMTQEFLAAIRAWLPQIRAAE